MRLCRLGLESRILCSSLSYLGREVGLPVHVLHDEVSPLDTIRWTDSVISVTKLKPLVLITVDAKRCMICLVYWCFYSVVSSDSVDRSESDIPSFTINFALINHRLTKAIPSSSPQQQIYPVHQPLHLFKQPKTVFSRCSMQPLNV
jgi:hypothetical protein